jgi:hypothetical protein
LRIRSRHRIRFDNRIGQRLAERQPVEQECDVRYKSDGQFFRQHIG